MRRMCMDTLCVQNALMVLVTVLYTQADDCFATAAFVASHSVSLRASVLQKQLSCAPLRVRTSVVRWEPSAPLVADVQDSLAFASASGDASAASKILREMAASEVEPSWHLATEMAQVVSRSQGTRALDELFSEVLNVVSWKWYNVAMARLHSHICELDMPMALRAAHETLAHGLCIEPSLVQRLVDTLHRKGIHIPLVKLLLCLIERAPAQEVPITCKMRGLGSCTSCQNFEAYLVIAKTMPSDRLLKASNLSITSMLSKLLNRGAVKEAQQVAELIPISGQYADGILMTMKARAHAAYGWSTTALQALRVAQEVFRMRIDSRVALSIARSVVLYDDFDSAVTIALMGNGMDRPHVQPLVKAIFAAGSALFKHVPTALRSFKPLNHPEWKSKSRTTHSDKRFANTPLVPPQSDVLGTQGLLEAAIDVPDHAKDVARRVIREQLPALLENATSTMLMDRVTLDQDTVNLAASFAYLFDALRKVGMLEEAVELLRLLSAPEYGNATFIDSYASNCVLRSAAVRENHFDLLNTLELLREIGAPINAYGAGTALAYCARCRGGVGRAMQMLDLLTMWNETAVLSPLTYVPAARLAYLEGFESLKQITEFLLRTVDKKILVREGEGSGMTRRDMQIGLVLQSAYTACRTAEEIVQLQRIALRKFSWNPTFEATNYGVDKIRMLSAPSSWVEVHQLLEDARSVRPELLNRLFLFNQTTAMAMLQCYSNSHNPEVALEALDKAIEVYPNQQQGTFAEGILLCKNNFDKALHLFQHIRTTRRFPCLNSYSNIVLVAKCTKRYHEMFAFFEEMLEKKGHVTAQSAHAISEFFKERNHTDGAVRYWIRLWSLFPQSRSQVIVRELLTAHAANHDWTRLKTKLVEISQYGMLTLSGRDIRDILTYYMDDPEASDLRSLLSHLAAVASPSNATFYRSGKDQNETLNLGLRHQTLAEFVVILSKGRPIDDMLILLQYLPAWHWPQAIVCATLCREGKTRELVWFVKKMLESGRKIMLEVIDMCLGHFSERLSMFEPHSAPPAMLRELAFIVQQLQMTNTAMFRGRTQDMYVRAMETYAQTFQLKNIEFPPESVLYISSQGESASTKTQRDETFVDGPSLSVHTLRAISLELHALIKSDNYMVALEMVDEFLSTNWRLEDDAQALDMIQLLNLWVHATLNCTGFKSLSKVPRFMEQTTLDSQSMSRIDLLGVAAIMKRATTACEWRTVVSVGKIFAPIVRTILVQSISQHGHVTASTAHHVEEGHADPQQEHNPKSQDTPAILFLAVQKPWQLQTGSQSIMELYMVACAHSNRGSTALRLLNEHRSMGLKLSWVAMDALVHALALNQDLVSTMVCLEIMFKSTMQPSNHVLERIVALALTNEKLELVLKLVELSHTRKHLLSRNQYTRILSRLLKGDQTGQAIALVQVVLELIDPADDKQRTLGMILLNLLDNSNNGQASAKLRRHFHKLNQRPL